MVEGVVRVTRGRDAEYVVRLVDSQRRPIDITGWTFALARHRKVDGSGSVDVSSPLSPGTDEVQTISYNLEPDAGSYKLRIGGETMVAIPFDAVPSDIESAINALPKQAGVEVSGSFAAGHVITFTGGSGKRNQPTIEIVENSLVLGVNAVNPVVTVNTEGSPERGVDVIDPKCGVLKVLLSEEETALMAKGKNQDIDICVRVGSKDLNIPPLKKVLEVEASPFEGS